MPRVFIVSICTKSTFKLLVSGSSANVVFGRHYRSPLAYFIQQIPLAITPGRSAGRQSLRTQTARPPRLDRPYAETTRSHSGTPTSADHRRSHRHAGRTVSVALGMAGRPQVARNAAIGEGRDREVGVTDQGRILIVI